MSLPPTAVVATAHDDALERDGELLVLVGSEVVLLSPLASALVTYAGSGASVGALATMLVEDFGLPADADPVSEVSRMVGELVEHGVLVVV